MKKLEFGVIALFVIMMLIIIFSGCSLSRSPAKIYQNTTASQMEYPAWLKRHANVFGHENASLKRSKDFLKQSKKASKKRAQDKEMRSKIDLLNDRAKAVNN
jgi:hypothetical protein